MKTSVDVKLKEYNLALLEEEYDRISIFVEDTKKNEYFYQLIVYRFTIAIYDAI